MLFSFAWSVSILSLMSAACLSCLEVRCVSDGIITSEFGISAVEVKLISHTAAPRMFRKACVNLHAAR